MHIVIIMHNKTGNVYSRDAWRTT